MHCTPVRLLVWYQIRAILYSQYQLIFSGHFVMTFIVSIEWCYMQRIYWLSMENMSKVCTCHNCMIVYNSVLAQYKGFFSLLYVLSWGTTQASHHSCKVNMWQTPFESVKILKFVECFAETILSYRRRQLVYSSCSWCMHAHFPLKYVTRNPFIIYHSSSNKIFLLYTRYWVISSTILMVPCV